MALTNFLSEQHSALQQTDLTFTCRGGYTRTFTTRKFKSWKIAGGALEIHRGAADGGNEVAIAINIDDIVAVDIGDRG
jgi:hypothetical protein